MHLVGRGLGAVIAAFAGCLHGVVPRVPLRNAPKSYEEMCEQPVCLWPRSVVAEGALLRFDLLELYKLLRREKRLWLVEPWNRLMRPLGEAR